MTDKKEKEVNKSAEDILKESSDAAAKQADEQKDVFPLGEANEKLNPAKDIADEAAEKDPADKTEQEKFVEGKVGVDRFHEAATSGAGAGGAGDDGLAGPAGSSKKIIPPETKINPDDIDESDLGDDENFQFHGESEEEVEFDPVNDPKAAHHGTHDAAVYGLHTDLSGTYVPPGLVKHAADTDAEAENQERLRRAQEQQRELAYDSGLRHDRRF